MKCTNNKCGKEFKDPLIRFNGDWHCPFCKSSIDPERNFEITIIPITPAIIGEILASTLASLILL